MKSNGEMQNITTGNPNLVKKNPSLGSS